MFPRGTIPNTASHDFRDNPLVKLGSDLLNVNVELPSLLSQDGVRVLHCQASNVSSRAVEVCSAASESTVKLGREALMAGGKALRQHVPDMFATARSTVKNYTSVTNRLAPETINDRSDPNERYLYHVERIARGEPHYIKTSSLRTDISPNMTESEPPSESVSGGTSSTIEWQPRLLSTDHAVHSHHWSRLRSSHLALPKPLRVAQCSCGKEPLVQGDSAAARLLQAKEGYWVGSIDGKRVYTKSGCTKGSVDFPEILHPKELVTQAGDGVGLVGALEDEDSDGSTGPCFGVVSDEEWGIDSGTKHGETKSSQHGPADDDESFRQMHQKVGRTSFYEGDEGADGWTRWKPAPLPVSMGGPEVSKLARPSHAVHSHLGNGPDSVDADTSGEESSIVLLGSRRKGEPSAVSTTGKARVKGEAKMDPTSTLSDQHPDLGSVNYFSSDAEAFLRASHNYSAFHNIEQNQKQQISSAKPSSKEFTIACGDSAPTSSRGGDKVSNVTAAQLSPPTTTMRKPQWMQGPSSGATTTATSPTNGLRERSRPMSSATMRTTGTTRLGQTPRPRWFPKST
ncbi:hypothetical protein IAU59_001158 [Kwoniella sp. CBS 9459]